MDIEAKGGFHFVAIVLITMVSLNALFIIYCCVTEKKRRSQKRKRYFAVSGDEFRFDEVNIDAEIDHDKNEKKEKEIDDG